MYLKMMGLPLQFIVVDVLSQKKYMTQVLLFI